MIRYFYCEAKLSIFRGLLIIPFFLGLLRLTRALSPEVPEIWAKWVSFLELVYPVVFSFLAFMLLEKDKQCSTLEVLIAAPMRKGLIFLTRFTWNALPLILAVVASVRPVEYLTLISTGFMLSGVVLLFGFLLGEEIGLGISLGWWSFSFVLLVTGKIFLPSNLGSWFVLFLYHTKFSHSELLARKCAHLGVGFAFLILAFVLADCKRSWSTR